VRPVGIRQAAHQKITRLRFSLSIVWAHHAKLSGKIGTTAEFVGSPIRRLFNSRQKTVKKVSVISSA
jgi:hypothetical protein